MQCLACGEPLKDKRRKYCNDDCKKTMTSEKSSKLQKGAGEKKKKAKSNGSAKKIDKESNPLLFPESALPKDIDPESPRLFDFSEGIFVDDNVTEADDKSFPIPALEPAIAAVAPSRSRENVVALSEALKEEIELSEAAKLFEQHINNSKIWITGETWFEVDVFDGNFETEWDGDFTSRFWVPVITSEFKKYNVHDLIDELKEEQGGGVFQIRFKRSSRLGDARMVVNPLILHMEGDLTMTRRQSSSALDPNVLLIQERKEKAAAQRAAEEAQKKALSFETGATEKLFEMQQAHLDDARAKEQELIEEIKDLKNQGGNQELIAIMQQQLDMARDDSNRQAEALAELQRELQKKDADFFAMFLEQREKAEKAAAEERRMQEERFNALAASMAERDERMFSRSMEAQGAEQTEMNQTLSSIMGVFQTQMQNQQQQFLQWQRMSEERAAEDRRQQEERQRQNRQDFLAMLDKVGTKNNPDEDRLTQYILTQQQQTAQSLELARQEQIRLQEKMFELATKNSSVDSLKTFVDHASAFGQAKNVLTEALNLPTAAVEAKEDTSLNWLDKATKLAETFKVDKIVTSLGERIAKPAKEIAAPTKPPSLPPPPAGVPTGIGGFMPPAAPSAPMVAATHAAAQFVQPAAPVPQVVAPVPQPQAPVPQAAAPVPQAAAPVPQAAAPPAPEFTLPEEVSNLVPTEEANQLVELIEGGIKNNTSAEVFVNNQLSEKFQMLLKLMDPADLVDNVLAVTSSPLIKSVRGKQWLTAIANYLKE